MDICEWWDLCAKPLIKEFCISFSIKRKRERNDQKNFLLSCLKLALAAKNWNEISQLKSKIKVLLKQDAIGYKVRCGFHQNAENEQASLYHAAKELKNTKNHLLNLRIGNDFVSSEDAIEQEVTSYFGALLNGHHDSTLCDTGSPFVPNNANLDSFLQGLTSMDPESSEKLEDDVDILELDYIIKQCANNKSPGIDGISYEFYKKTWSIIRVTFAMVIQCQLDRQRLVDSNSVGATMLLSKVQGIPRVDELRPITLLNCDYRILTILLVLRMKPVLPEIIKSGQLCTIGSKSIFSGVRNIILSVLYVKQKNLGACILSLDFFKAYDRVLISFLLVVMKKMGFGSVFCSWIKMLHTNARTNFLLRRLTRAIDICFSIRQGDPIAMILYILYAEPLLIYIERCITGLRIVNITQKLEAYCDDVNVMTTDINVLVKVDEAVRGFEEVSGAILSRNLKCKVMGLGRWRRKCTWPLNYLQTVDAIKIFGFYIMDSYRDILKKNWDYRYQKFENTVFSWSSRRLLTLKQRVEVIKTFAYSKLYYVASVLPMSKTLCKKFEKVVGRFIWSSSGKILRIALNELKLPPNRGGLGLPCLSTVSTSLQLSQLLKLMKSNDSKSLSLILYWIGESLSDFLPDIMYQTCNTVVPSYFNIIAEYLTDARISEFVTVTNWRRLTNKIIYKKNVDLFPVARVEYNSNFSFDNIRRNLESISFSTSVHEVLLLLIHDKLPMEERLFRINLKQDPYCSFCLESFGIAAIADREHYFCSCQRTSTIWNNIKQVLQVLLHNYSSFRDLDLLTLDIPRQQATEEAVWLISNYVHMIWVSNLNI